MKSTLRTARWIAITTLWVTSLVLASGCSARALKADARYLGDTVFHLRSSHRLNVIAETYEHLRGGQDLSSYGFHFRNGGEGLSETARGIGFFFEPFDLGEVMESWRHLSR